MSQIFNPLNHISTSSEVEVSESRFVNDRPGVCPKCNESMSTAKLANDDEVYFCERDCVTAPMVDS
jgi:hypothetical protein